MTETLCTYYRKKMMIQELVNFQNVLSMQWVHECEMMPVGGMLLSHPPKQKYVCPFCGKHEYRKY
jgi:hypothetical protein